MAVILILSGAFFLLGALGVAVVVAGGRASKALGDPEVFDLELGP